MTKTAELTISVIIPVHNGGGDFRQCMLSLAEAVPPPNEIIVVANGDKDGSGHLAEEFDAKVLKIPTPIGPARARNLGARTTRADVLFFVDADVAIAPDAIGQIRTAFMRTPEIAAIFGSYDDEPAANSFLSQYKNLLHHYVHQTANEEASTFWSGCGAIKRKVFWAMDGFDESYRQPCIEDIELGYRLKQAGHRIRLHKSLQGKHLKRWNFVSLLKADFFQRALPWTKLILRDRQLVNDLNLDGSSRISVISVYGLLVTLLGAIWWPVFLFVAGVFILLLFALNAPLYRFFWHKRGVWFAILAIPWHWFYYFYGGLAFALGIVLYLLPGGRKSAANLPLGGGESL